MAKPLYKKGWTHAQDSHAPDGTAIRHSLSAQGIENKAVTNLHSAFPRQEDTGYPDIPPEELYPSEYGFLNDNPVFNQMTEQPRELQEPPTLEQRRPIDPNMPLFTQQYTQDGGVVTVGGKVIARGFKKGIMDF